MAEGGVVVHQHTLTQSGCIADDRPWTNDRPATDVGRGGHDGRRMDQGCKLRPLRFETIRNRAPYVRHSNREQEVVTRTFLISLHRAKDSKPGRESFKSTGIVGQEPRYQARMLGPGIAGPLQYFPPKTACAND